MKVKIEVLCDSEKCDMPGFEWHWDEKSNLPKCPDCNGDTFTWHNPKRHAFKSQLFKSDGSMRSPVELMTGIDEEEE